MMESNPTETSAQVYVTTGNEYFEFKVAACSNVKVVLISEIGGQNSTYYEIGIGYNDNTNITIFDSKIGRVRNLICTNEIIENLCQKLLEFLRKFAKCYI